MFNWGIIGPGRIARQFAESIATLDDACVYAVSSHNRDKAQAFADKYGAKKVFADYSELAKCAEVDAIYVATTNPYHHSPTVLCLETGKPVLCEKPLALNSVQAEDMINAAKKTNTFFMEAMWTRFLPHIVQVRKWIEEGMIGSPRIVKAGFCVHTNSSEDDRWLNINQGGGALLDLGIYPLSFAAMVLGTEYEALSSAGCLTPTGVDEHCAIQLKYPGGQIAQVSCSLFSAGPSSALILGTEGYIEIDRFVFSKSAKLVRGNQTTTFASPDFGGTGFRYEAMEAQKCITSGKTQSDIMSWDESFKIMKIIDRAKADMGLKYPQE